MLLRMRMKFLVGVVGIAVALVGLCAGTATAAPTAMRGVVVDAATGAGVGGVTVEALDPVDLTIVAGTDVTNGRGRFRIGGLTSDEYAVYVDGSGAGYESGYLACSGDIVPTYGEACTAGTGNLGDIALDVL
jgi:hypothetical protein